MLPRPAAIMLLPAMQGCFVWFTYRAFCSEVGGKPHLQMDELMLAAVPQHWLGMCPILLD